MQHKEKTVNVVPDNIQLRDYFAGQALAGMLVNGFVPMELNYTDHNRFNYVVISYDIADAMLKERAK